MQAPPPPPAPPPLTPDAAASKPAKPFGQKKAASVAPSPPPTPQARHEGSKKLRQKIHNVTQTPDSGHIFVLFGDIKTLYCDYFLVPCGSLNYDLHITVLKTWIEPFIPFFGAHAQATHEFRVDLYPTGLDLLAPGIWRPKSWPDGTPIPIFYQTDLFVNARPSTNSDGSSEPDVHVKPFFDMVPKLVKDKRVYSSRVKPLVAIPAVGTGNAGGRSVTGRILEFLFLEMSEATVKHGYDVALVLFDKATFAMAQQLRLELGIDQMWAALKPQDAKHVDMKELVLKAQELATLAKQGNMVLFLGAGVSVGAGLPMWGPLLNDLAKSVGLSSDDDQLYFNALDFLAKAQLIQHRMGSASKLGEAIAKAMTKQHHSLTHALLAGLPVTQVVTTNYDRLFELASSGSEYRKLSVLPHAPIANCDRWILKMHGCISKPESIVLTRQDYLRYHDTNAALTGIVQAMLITSRMVFVGFSLQDDNFHRIADGVKKAFKEPTGRTFGTNLTLISNPLSEELWTSQIEFQAVYKPLTKPTGADFAAAGRRQEIFLDLILALSSSAGAYLLDPRFRVVLSAEEENIHSAVSTFMTALPPDVQKNAAWPKIDQFLKSLGMDKPATVMWRYRTPEAVAQARKVGDLFGGIVSSHALRHVDAAEVGSVSKEAAAAAAGSAVDQMMKRQQAMQNAKAAASAALPQTTPPLVPTAPATPAVPPAALAAPPPAPPVPASPTTAPPAAAAAPLQPAVSALPTQTNAVTAAPASAPPASIVSAPASPAVKAPLDFRGALTRSSTKAGVLPGSPTPPPASSSTPPADKKPGN